MNKFLSFILIVSFLSISSVDFFHLQFHNLEQEQISKSANSPKTGSIPIDDHCDFEKNLSLISKYKAIESTSVGTISQIVLSKFLAFQKIEDLFEVSFISSHSARGPPVRS